MISTRYLLELAYKVIDNRLSLAKAKKIAGKYWKMFEAVYLDTLQFKQNLETYEKQIQAMRILSVITINEAINRLEEIYEKREAFFYQFYKTMMERDKSGYYKNIDERNKNIDKYTASLALFKKDQLTAYYTSEMPREYDKYSDHTTKLAAFLDNGIFAFNMPESAEDFNQRDDIEDDLKIIPEKLKEFYNIKNDWQANWKDSVPSSGNKEQDYFNTLAIKFIFDNMEDNK